MFGFKPLSEDENLIKLKKAADDLHETADKLGEFVDILEQSVDKFVSKKNDKNRKRT